MDLHLDSESSWILRAQIQLLTYCCELASSMWVTMDFQTSNLITDMPLWNYVYLVCGLFSFYLSNCSLVQHSIWKTRHIESLVKARYDVKIWHPFLLLILFTVIIQVPSLPAFAGLTNSLFYILFFVSHCHIDSNPHLSGELLLAYTARIYSSRWFSDGLELIFNHGDGHTMAKWLVHHWEFSIWSRAHPICRCHSCQLPL